YVAFFFFYRSHAHRALLSFPTRRSSDLLAFAEIAAFVALTICGTLELADPVQDGLGRPSSAAASASPYWVGTKNGLVVTWLTKADRKSTRLNSSHDQISYAVFCLKKKSN